MTPRQIAIDALREFGIKCASELNVTGTVLRFADEKAESAADALLAKLAALPTEPNGDPAQVRPIGWRFKYKESDDWNYTENAKAAKRYKDREYFVQPVYATPEQPR